MNANREPRPIPVATSAPDLLLQAGLGLACLAGFGLFLEPGGFPTPGVTPGLLDRISSTSAQAISLLPALALVVRGLARRDFAGLAGFALVAGLSWALEAVGVRTGLPFGRYSYSEGLGAHLPGGVPWTIPLSWAASALVFHSLSRIRFPGRSATARRIATTATLLLALDLVLDPAMSRLNDFWSWEAGGAWYGVPLSNLAAWWGAGLVFATLLERIRSREGDGLPAAWVRGQAALLFPVPAGMALLGGMPGAVAASGALALGILWKGGPDRDLATEPVPSPGEPGGTDFMARHSRSFRFASRFLSPSFRARVAGVYAWCRLTDDLVDEAGNAPPEEVSARLDAWERMARDAYEGLPVGDPLVRRVFAEMARDGVPFSLAADLLEAMRTDLQPGMRWCTPEHLKTYSYGVASVLGIWLTRAAGVEDPWVLERAEALGHAMQLTNILRDVGEDLGRGRVYIPLSELSRFGLSEEDLHRYASGSRPVDAAWKGLVESLMDRADRDYALAFEAMPHLPRSLRWGVAVSAEVYRGIHGAIRDAGYDNFRHRAATGGVTKLLLAAQGLVRLAAASRPRTTRRQVAPEAA